MLQKLTSALGALAVFGMLAAPVPAAAQTSTEVPTYGGAVYIIAINPACRADGIEVGTSFWAIFRSLRRPSNGQGGGLHLIGRQQIFTYVTSNNQTLPGGRRQGTFRGLGTSGQVGIFNFQSTYDLGIAPAAITNTTTTVTVNGSLTNFNDVDGCTVRIRGAFTLRP